MTYLFALFKLAIITKLLLQRLRLVSEHFEIKVDSVVSEKQPKRSIMRTLLTNTALVVASVLMWSSCDSYDAGTTDSTAAPELASTSQLWWEIGVRLVGNSGNNIGSSQEVTIEAFDGSYYEAVDSDGSSSGYNWFSNVNASFTVPPWPNAPAFKWLRIVYTGTGSGNRKKMVLYKLFNNVGGNYDMGLEINVSTGDIDYLFNNSQGNVETCIRPYVNLSAFPLYTPTCAPPSNKPPLL